MPIVWTQLGGSLQRGMRNSLAWRSWTTYRYLDMPTDDGIDRSPSALAARLYEVIRRRMAHTGERYELAKEQVLEAVARVNASVEAQPKGWLQAWIAPGAPDPDPEGVGWMLSREPPIQALLRRFPPSCVVCTKPWVFLVIPPPNRPGIVVGYSSAEGGPFVTVSMGPGTSYSAHVDPDDLEVVGYHKGQTREWVASILDRPPAVVIPLPGELP